MNLIPCILTFNLENFSRWKLGKSGVQLWNSFFFFDVTAIMDILCVKQSNVKRRFVEGTSTTAFV